MEFTDDLNILVSRNKKESNDLKALFRELFYRREFKEVYELANDEERAELRGAEGEGTEYKMIEGKFEEFMDRKK